MKNQNNGNNGNADIVVQTVNCQLVVNTELGYYVPLVEYLTKIVVKSTSSSQFKLIYWLNQLIFEKQTK